jgi:hypothetical protein
MSSWWIALGDASIEAALGMVETIEALGIEVKPMGVPLTEALKDPADRSADFLTPTPGRPTRRA